MFTEVRQGVRGGQEYVVERASETNQNASVPCTFYKSTGGKTYHIQNQTKKIELNLGFIDKKV